MSGRKLKGIAVNSLSQGYSFGGVSPPSPKGRADREQKRKESEKMKWQWFRKDAWGFTLGVISMLVGIYEMVLYADAAGQRGAEILVYTGGLMIFAGLTHNVYITIWWLRNKTGRHTDTRD